MSRLYALLLLLFVNITSAQLVTADIQQMVEASVEQPQVTVPTVAAVKDLSSPHVANSVVLAWSNEALVSSFSYDFANYQRSFQLASDYYTPHGWLDLQQRHSQLQDLATIIKHKMSLSTVAIAPPVIISQGPFKDGYSWLVESKIMLTMANIKETNSRNFIVRSVVLRDNPSVHPRGLAIQSIAMKYLLDKSGPRDVDSVNETHQQQAALTATNVNDKSTMATMTSLPSSTEPVFPSIDEFK